VALVAAFLCFFVGVGPILFRRNAIFLMVGVAMALDFWVLGQAFGQVFTGMATDPNTGPLLVLLALAVYRAGVPAGAPAEMRRQERSSSAFATRTGSLVS
jgi:NADH:ubiquinone oxidoreductase subunit K